MSNRFQYCLKWVLQPDIEGGYSNDPVDKGGPTNHGVTQKVYTEYLKSLGLPDRDVKNIHDSEVEAIYSKYWQGCKASYCPEPLDLLMFDSAVQHGPAKSVKLLQKTLGVAEDGVFGRQTIDALHEDVVAIGIKEVCKYYLDHRASFYDSIIKRDPSQAKFAKGWMNRIDHLREQL